MEKSVADYATWEDLLSVDWNKTVGFALRKMKESHRSCLLIVNREGEVIGIVTEHDEESTQPLTEFCKRELKTITAKEAKEMSSVDAAQYMVKNGFHRITIKESGRVGIFTSTDFIKMVAEGN